MEPQPETHHAENPQPSVDRRRDWRQRERARGDAPLRHDLTRSVTFDADMVCPPGVDGLVIGADNVAIDLNGFSMIGPNSGTTHGVLSLGFHGTRILGPGSILDFFGLVRIDGGDNHVILDVQALGFACGIALYNTSGPGRCHEQSHAR